MLVEKQARARARVGVGANADTDTDAHTDAATTDTNWWSHSVGSRRLLITIVFVLIHAGFLVEETQALTYRSSSTSSLLPVSLIRAQCRASCLRKFLLQSSELRGLAAERNDLHTWCIGDTSCTYCYDGCDAPTLPTSDACSVHCSNSNPNPNPSQGAASSAAIEHALQCNDSCRTMHSLLASAPMFNMHLPYALINEPRETSIETAGNGGSATSESALEIEWSLPSNSNITDPVLFVLEARYCIGPYFEEYCASHWRPLTMTTRLGAEMSDVKIGWRYQFRIAAVSIDGTRGFKQTSPASLRAEPRAPNPPENLTEIRTTLRNSKVDVEIRWDAPRKSDLEVHRYRLYWSKKLDDAQALVLSSKEYSRTTVRNEQLYVIEDLEPDAVYSVSVQAISLYGGDELLSSRATFYISTLAIASANVTRKNGGGAAQRQLFPVIVNHTFYEDDDLRALVMWPLMNMRVNILRFHVSWRPLACIGEPSVSTRPLDGVPTAHRYAVIDRLIFDCRYEVIVRPMTADDRQLIPSTTLFDTPSCAKVQSRLGSKPKCADSRPLPAVATLTSSLVTASDPGSYAVNVSWRPLARSVNEIANYRIVWGRHGRQLPQAHKLSASSILLHLKDPMSAIDKKDAVTVVVPRNTSWWLISGLESNVFYNVEVTARSADGDGLKAYLDFYKPSNADMILLSETTNESFDQANANPKSSRSAPKSKPMNKNSPDTSALSSLAATFACPSLAFVLCAIVHLAAAALAN